MAKEIITKHTQQIEISDDIFNYEFVIIFPKSQVFAYVYAVTAAKNSDFYAEGTIGKRLHHIACFRKIDKSYEVISIIVKMLYHTRGIQIFIHGKQSSPYKVFDVISCYVGSTKMLDTSAYCFVKVDDRGLPFTFQSNEISENILPCRLLSGIAYQRVNNTIGPKDNIIDALAIDEEIYWCPSFKKNYSSNLTINDIKLINDED